MATALATLMSLPSVPLAPESTPLAPLARLRSSLGSACPQLLIKRDDLLAFAMGGNKVRKMQVVAAEALAAGADTLITCGGVQSNHARVTAAAGAVLGMRVILVVNGSRPEPLTGNARLDAIFGADVRYVQTRDERDSTMAEIASALQREGKRPFVIPLGASTPAGALGFARGVGEIAVAGVKADVIVHSTSSGGTQAGLIAGCALFGLRTRVLGISADDPSASLQQTVRQLLTQIADRLGAAGSSVGADRPIDVDDRFVGDGYGIPTAASTEALELLARTEGIILDPVYTAKAMAGLLARIRAGEFGKDETIVFWHTGGLPGLFS